ncbi:unnamed protein product [Orchesella dallaii]|uniref:Major facilitator superfamily (MFS) profile domain-containing protein n=1 Tax=Orchesella dallaii TaxID=48710 RepID=A0ABP1PPF8_9HEXA
MPNASTKVIGQRLRKSRVPQIQASLAVALGAFSVGNVLGWSSPGLPSLLTSGHFPDLTKSDVSWIGSIITLGALVGSILTGFCIEMFGRRNSILIAAFPLLAGWSCIVIASNYHFLYLIFGRLFTGIGMGCLLIAGPIYLSEIAEPEIRGTLTSTFSVHMTLGIVFTYILGCFVNYKILAAVCGAVPIFMLAAVSLLPESPRFFITRWKIQQTVDSFCWLHGCDKKSPSPEVLQEMRELQDALGGNDEEIRSIFKQLSSWKVMKPLLTVFGIMLVNQLSGGNAFAFYTVMIFEGFNEGAGLVDSHLSAVIVSLFQLVSVTSMFVLVDKVGRRVLLVCMFLVMSSSLVTLGMLDYFKYDLERVISKDGCNWISLVCFVLLNAAYSGGPSVLSWTLMSELVPSNIMGLASGATTGFNWILAFLTTRFFHDIVEVLGLQLTFFMFSIFALSGALFIHFVVPETKGKSLEGIQRENFHDDDDKVIQ